MPHSSVCTMTRRKADMYEGKWLFVSALDEEYCFQQLLLSVPHRRQDLLSDSNVSKTQWYLRNLIRQEEDAFSSLEDAILVFIT